MHHKNGIIETKTEHCVRIYFRKRGFIFMKYINELREGNRMSGVYLCKHKQSAVTKNGKQYENVILQDTGKDMEILVACMENDPHAEVGAIDIEQVIHTEIEFEDE